MTRLLDYSFYGNSALAWTIAAGVALLVLAALWGVNWFVKRRFAAFAKKSRFTFDDVIVDVLKATRFWFLVLVAVWLGSLSLDVPADLHDDFGVVLRLAFILQAAFWGTAAIRSWIDGYVEARKDSDPAAATTMRAVGVVGRMALWALLFVAALGALGIQIAPLLAGLGIGGIAVALAVQNVLGDLFASLSIVLDKPFVIGDFVVVGDMAGTVENIGLKTTRVRSLSGEQLVFSNSDMLNSRIRNYKRMFERRVVFAVGVTYQTPRAKLERIPARVREIVEALPEARFDRAHLRAFGASSIDFEIVWYAQTPDYNVYMDRQQSINLAIHEFFEAEGIEFAYPTQTIFLAGEEGEGGVGDAPPELRTVP